MYSSEVRNRQPSAHNKADIACRAAFERLPFVTQNATYRWFVASGAGWRYARSSGMTCCGMRDDETSAVSGGAGSAGGVRGAV